MNSAGPATTSRAPVLQRMLAWRFFSGGRRTALVSMISSISLAGMVIAVALLVLVLSVMNGFEREFRERILGMVPHATLWVASDAQIENTLAQLRKRGEVLQALPFIEFKALAIRAGNAEPVLVQGTDFQRFMQSGAAFIDGGDGERPHGLAADELVMGAGLVKKLGATVGDRLRLMVMRPTGQAASASLSEQMQAGNRTQVHSVKLAAVLRTGSELDQRVALMSLQGAAVLGGNSAGFDGVQLQFHNIFDAPRLASELAFSLPEVLRFSDWSRSYGNLYTAIQLSRQIVVLLLASIVAIAAFNIFVTLGMVVRHKRREIAILRTMGLSRRDVLGVFIRQGMVVAILGAGIGLLLGVVLTWCVPVLVNALQDNGRHLLSTEIYPIDYLPSELRARDLMLISGIALGMSFLATLLPARQAARLQPASVLNGKDS